MQHWNLTINLANHSGELSKVTGILAKAGVNIEGFSCTGHGDHAWVNFLVSDKTAAVHAFEHASVKVESVTEVMVEHIEHRVGVLADIVNRIHEHGVDLTVAYLATETRLVLGAHDMTNLHHAWTSSAAAARN